MDLDNDVDNSQFLNSETKQKVPEVVTWTVDTVCPDTTFVVLPDVVTHLTSEVLVVKGGADAVSFEYTLEKLDVQVKEEGEEQSAGGDGSGSSGDGGAGGGSSPSSSSPSSSRSSHASHRSSSASASSPASADDSRVWQPGDASGVIHLHRLQV